MSGRASQPTPIAFPPLPAFPWSVRETRVPIADTGDHDVFIDVVDATGKLVVSFNDGDKEIAIARAVAALPEMLGAIAISNKADEELFAHCVGGSVCNSRGEAMDCATLNNASLSRKLAIRKAEGRE